MFAASTFCNEISDKISIFLYETNFHNFDIAVNNITWRRDSCKIKYTIADYIYKASFFTSDIPCSLQLFNGISKTISRIHISKLVVRLIITHMSFLQQMIMYVIQLDWSVSLCFYDRRLYHISEIIELYSFRAFVIFVAMERDIPDITPHDCSAMLFCRLTRAAELCLMVSHYGREIYSLCLFSKYKMKFGCADVPESKM